MSVRHVKDILRRVAVQAEHADRVLDCLGVAQSRRFALSRSPKDVQFPGSTVVASSTRL